MHLKLKIITLELYHDFHSLMCETKILPILFKISFKFWELKIENTNECYYLRTCVEFI